MRVAEVVGRTLAQLGVSHVFGVVGSGNFHVTNALIAGGARFVATRHEQGAAMMADAFARATDRVAVVSLHQGCGLTNALTGLTEAAKSRTPIVVVSGDTPPTQQTSNFWIDQSVTARALGIDVERVHAAGTAVDDARRAFQRAFHDRRTVLLNLPLDVQERDADGSSVHLSPLPRRMEAVASTTAAARTLADHLTRARRPLILAGRGALNARSELEQLADKSRALLATSAVARGLFSGNPWSIDVMGGFATPTSAELIEEADLVVAFGASMNRWTTRNDTMPRPTTPVLQVDVDGQAIGRHRPVDVAIVGDSAAVAADASSLVERDNDDSGYRTGSVAARIARGCRWQDVAFEDTSTSDRIDPRKLTIALDETVPSARVVVPDGGNFNGYPAMFFDIPDQHGYCLPLAFQSIGLALPAAIGAAIANPDRIVIAGVGDGGFMMSLTELDTAVRERLALLIVVYNDAAYGAEVHHFADEGARLDTVTFPDTDIAAIARGFGCRGITVRDLGDLEGVREWLQRPLGTPLVVDAKISSFPSWVLAHTF